MGGHEPDEEVDGSRPSRPTNEGPMTIELVFETHSTTQDNENGVATGWGPGTLSPAGREQARRLGTRRIDDGIDAIFASDLGRAIETVSVAFPAPAVPIFLDWRLRECDYGSMTAVPAGSLRRSEHLEAPYPAGESWRQAVDRVAWFLRDVTTGWEGSRILVIGHTATRWGLDHLISGEPLDTLVATPFEWQEGWEYRIG
jgi:2,3-bisphosphoglycerate-dependent phosphoglycerate mutase